MPTSKDIWERLVETDSLWEFVYTDAKVPQPCQDDLEANRKSCEQNVCGCHGTTWGCPPGVGTIDECRDEMKSYKNAVVIHRRYKVDKDNARALKRISDDLQRVVRRFAGKLRENGFDVLPLADGGCTYCATCSYPDSPCRVPEKLVPSIGGYGINMVDYLADNGLDLSIEDDYANVFGIVLFTPPEGQVAR